jgi:hypothetical protein
MLNSILIYFNYRVTSMILYIYTSSSRFQYSKKDYKRKKNEQHSHKIGTWNVRTLNRGGKLQKFEKGNAEERGVYSRC